MKRVLIIGPGGAGKTTLTRRLARQTGLPIIHLDQLYWRPDWQATPEAEWRAKVGAVVRDDSWIMDGNYGGTLDIRLAACDTVVFLDVPRVVCVWRVIKRQVQHVGRSRDELPAGCPERVTWEFLRWIWTYPARRRTGIIERLNGLANDKEVVMLRSPREVERFLADASRADSPRSDTDG